MGNRSGLATLGLVVAVLLASVAPAGAITEEEERAKAHFLAGQSYYDQASYTDALREFNEAYRISKRPALLYNIARCFEALEQFGDAVSMLERYLGEDPTTSDRQAIEARIGNLKERQAALRLRPRAPAEPPEPSRPPTPQPQATAPPSKPPPASTLHRPRLWTWVVGGAGLAVLAAAAGTGIASQLGYNDLSHQCAGDGRCDPATVSNARGRIDRGRSLTLATDVLWPIGAVAAAAGVALFFLEGRHAIRHAEVAPFVTPSSAGVVLARSF